MLLEKLEILDKVEIYRYDTEKFTSAPLFWAVIIILVLAALSCLVHHAVVCDEWVFPVFFILALIVGGIGVFLTSKSMDEALEPIPTGRYRYSAIIEDAELLKEVYETYDIVEAKGHIYIFEERKE